MIVSNSSYTFGCPSVTSDARNYNGCDGASIMNLVKSTG